MLFDCVHICVSVYWLCLLLPFLGVSDTISHCYLLCTVVFLYKKRASIYGMFSISKKNKSEKKRNYFTRGCDKSTSCCYSFLLLLLLSFSLVYLLFFFFFRVVVLYLISIYTLNLIR